MVSRAWLRTLTKTMRDQPELMGTSQTMWALADDQVDQYLKGHHYNLKEKQLALVDKLKEEGKLELRWNSVFFSKGDSKMPENAGILSA
ncbi:DUF3333 domain-containing protein, partial [Oleiphilus sp. HI0128]|uniref:DUF3333 domain-containing protein n=1 Tax=Oleiphilus sp. HI0128 TaxID=1822267 RepID=UPI0018D44FD2